MAEVLDCSHESELDDDTIAARHLSVSDRALILNPSAPLSHEVFRFSNMHKGKLAAGLKLSANSLRKSALRALSISGLSSAPIRLKLEAIVIRILQENVTFERAWSASSKSETLELGRISMGVSEGPPQALKWSPARPPAIDESGQVTNPATQIDPTTSGRARQEAFAKSDYARLTHVIADPRNLRAAQEASLPQAREQLDDPSFRSGHEWELVFHPQLANPECRPQPAAAGVDGILESDAEGIDPSQPAAPPLLANRAPSFLRDKWVDLRGRRAAAKERHEQSGQNDGAAFARFAQGRADACCAHLALHDAPCLSFLIRILPPSARQEHGLPESELGIRASPPTGSSPSPMGRRSGGVKRMRLEGLDPLCDALRDSSQLSGKESRYREQSAKAKAAMGMLKLKSVIQKELDVASADEKDSLEIQLKGAQDALRGMHDQAEGDE